MHLPSNPILDKAPEAPRLARLAARLARETRAEVRFAPADRALYATDAGLYQIPPLGVVVPADRLDFAAAAAIVAEEGLPVLPRGGATSLSGQTIGPAVVFDLSKNLNRVDELDVEARTVLVEPGVVLDELNARLKPAGLMFGPDVSTSDRATIGGMIGNNSAGARSLKYGKTVDHVDQLDVILDDGTPATFRPIERPELERLKLLPDRHARLHALVDDVVRRHEPAIRAKFPRILRRVSGYNLDEFLPGFPVRPRGWPEEPFRFNLARLVVGSEGTLALVARAKLRLVPAPNAAGLAVLAFRSIPEALERVPEMVDAEPVSVEMIDRPILELAANNPEYARALTFLPPGPLPDAVLAAQFHAESHDELARRVARLRRAVQNAPGLLAFRENLDAAGADDFWKVRKAGLSLLMGMLGDAKPVAFVEDTAVPPERLAEYHRRFEQLLARRGLRASCYGHADVGCLHIRPILNTKDPRDVENLRELAAEVAELVLEFGGAMSGEHGDGLARSRWNRVLFGEEVYRAFREVKRAFDPRNRLNPGKVVAEPDPGADLRLGPEVRLREPESTVFDFAGQGGFARAVELCSGVGACRKTRNGVMCPSYRITRDEEHSTRGRANLLRLVMAGTLVPDTDGLAHEALDRALDLCLQCKACKTECPSNVDMAKLKSEYLHQTHQSGARPLPVASRVMARIHDWYPLASLVAPLLNPILAAAPARVALEKLAGVDRRRRLPEFVPTAELLRTRFRRRGPSNPPPGTPLRGTVILLDDCFTNHHAPETGLAAVEVLEAAGYRVRLAQIPCCGRPAISKGLLDHARDLAERSVHRLARLLDETGAVAVVGVEPSCIVTLQDEFRDFRLGPEAERVAERTLAVEAFVADENLVPELPLQPLPATVKLHGHCQQRALHGLTPTLKALARVPGLRVQPLDSGCCGMAGSFGYEKSHYDLSVALADQVLRPHLRDDPGTEILAPGFSCRSQIKDLDRKTLRHPVQLLARQLPPRQTPNPTPNPNPAHPEP